MRQVIESGPKTPAMGFLTRCSAAAMRSSRSWDETVTESVVGDDDIDD
jgi:hypothetical protein